MAKKKRSVGKPAGGRKYTKIRKHAVKKKAARAKKGRRAGKKGPQPRVFRRVANLAADALAALEVGNTDEARRCLEAIRAVGVCADEDR